ncbi:succinate dehydrogenase assembly factor 2 [Lichenihabitans sp. Uapishka_5]|uniref:FAD assembly factor SdhE n=1 Tax=Lichenihabitans sp. Uapishka_5 TaxID=3037302 RepID=UPI0029E7FE51|nr:succinate dehydrogenase assembly factor 2 [Lichenihabitans sp. Uapishka_5]MDX7953753.1 succinate dehydrogenase assembly factor 2 [Lichenihabitans sp. Uapishka_5]
MTVIPDPIPDARRRRLVFRAWHRGTREMDLVMGRFTEAEVAGLSDIEVGDLELLMEANDRDVFDWVSGMTPVPANYDTPVFRRLCAFHLNPTA